MAIHKEKLTEQYASIPNRTLRDPRLSPDALGVLTFLLSLPSDWQVRAEQVRKHFKVGKLRQQRFYRELEEAGYLKREKMRGSDGCWTTGVTIYQTSLKPYLTKAEESATG